MTDKQNWVKRKIQQKVQVPSSGERLQRPRAKSRPPSGVWWEPLRAGLDLAATPGKPLSLDSLEDTWIPIGALPTLPSTNGEGGKGKEGCQEGERERENDFIGEIRICELRFIVSVKYFVPLCLKGKVSVCVTQSIHTHTHKVFHK